VKLSKEDVFRLIRGTVEDSDMIVGLMCPIGSGTSSVGFPGLKDHKMVVVVT